MDFYVTGLGQLQTEGEKCFGDLQIDTHVSRCSLIKLLSPVR